MYYSRFLLYEITSFFSALIFVILYYAVFIQVVGAFWYLFSIERETTCWRKACAMRTPCDLGALYCDLNQGPVNNAYLNESCPITSDNTGPFDFGMFMNALTSGVVETTDFPKKFLFCFWWGLQNLRSAYLIFLIAAYFLDLLFSLHFVVKAISFSLFEHLLVLILLSAFSCWTHVS